MRLEERGANEGVRIPVVRVTLALLSITLANDALNCSYAGAG